MSAKSKTQELVWHVFGADDINGATLSDTEWDTAGIHSASVVLIGGNTVGAAVAAFSVHASDTTGFTPGSGNKIGEITSGLPDGAKEACAIHLPDLGTAGRYVRVIATAGAAASDVAVVGVGHPSDSGPNSATERGLVAEAYQS